MLSCRYEPLSGSLFGSRAKRKYIYFPVSCRSLPVSYRHRTRARRAFILGRGGRWLRLFGAPRSDRVLGDRSGICVVPLVFARTNWFYAAGAFFGTAGYRFPVVFASVYRLLE